MTRLAPGLELTDNAVFSRRVRRLIVIASVALGVIWGIAYLQEAPAAAQLLLVAGWVLMPTVLSRSLRRPSLRYWLIVPATCTTLGLVWVAMAAPETTASGWWLITLGVSMGGGLGMWLWYRWAPVPRILNDPFGPGRLFLIALHAGVVLVGIGMVWLGL